MAEQGIQDPWTIALTAVLVEGIIFILLTLCKFREALVNDVPENLKMGIAAGIGLFIALVGLANAGVVVGHEQGAEGRRDGRGREHRPRLHARCGQDGGVDGQDVHHGRLGQCRGRGGQPLYAD